MYLESLCVEALFAHSNIHHREAKKSFSKQKRGEMKYAPKINDMNSSKKTIFLCRRKILALP